MTHHEFCKAIALYWINPEEYRRDLKVANLAFKLRKRKSSASVSSISMDSSLQQDRTPPTSKKIKTGVHYVSDTSLCPSSGVLKCRLDKNLDHIPDEAPKRARCRLHWWGGVETQAKNLVCPTCAVSLCTKCYQLFHK